MSAPPFLSPMLVSYEGQWGNQRADLVMNADGRAEEALTPVQKLRPLDSLIHSWMGTRGRMAGILCLQINAPVTSECREGSQACSEPGLI